MSDSNYIIPSYHPPSLPSFPHFPLTRYTISCSSSMPRTRFCHSCDSSSAPVVVVAGNVPQISFLFNWTHILLLLRLLRVLTRRRGIEWLTRKWRSMWCHVHIQHDITLFDHKSLHNNTKWTLPLYPQFRLNQQQQPPSATTPFAGGTRGTYEGLTEWMNEWLKAGAGYVPLLLLNAIQRSSVVTMGDQNNNNITVNPVHGESRRPCIVSVVPREESLGKEKEEQEIKER